MRPSDTHLNTIRIAVREEAHMLHVNNDTLEHLQALMQQGKPAQATVTVVKAVTR